MSVVASLLLPAKPAAKRIRQHVVEHFFGIEFPFLTGEARVVGKDKSCCQRTSTDLLVKPFDVCGWCGDSRGCKCEAMMEVCAESGCFFEKAVESSNQLEGIDDDDRETSIGTMSAIDSFDESSSSCSDPTPPEVAELCEAAFEDSARTFPDFSGKWIFRRYEGDFDAMMEDAGTHWTIRRLARGANYGIGMLSQDICQHGEHMKVVFNAGGSVTTMEYNVGEAGQATWNEAGEWSLVNSAWEGQALHVAGVRTKDGSRMQETFRYMHGHEMVVETRLTSGQTVRRFYEQ